MSTWSRILIDHEWNKIIEYLALYVTETIIHAGIYYNHGMMVSFTYSYFGLVIHNMEVSITLKRGFTHL